MNVNKENIEKQNFRIKLLAGNNVVLVETENYESEIFVPHIVSGRITFQNIIPNRRCCRFVGEDFKGSIRKLNKKQPNESTLYMQEQNVRKSRKLGRVSAGQDATMPPPLANSTPAGIKQRASSSGGLSSKNFYNSNAYVSTNDSTLPTPEPVRRAVTTRTQKFENSVINLPKGIKVARLYHNPVEGTPKKVGRLISSSGNASCRLDSTNISLLNGSFKIPSTPSMCNSNRKKRTTANKVAEMPMDSIARWRKVLTPVRTYSKNPVINRRPVSIASAKKALRPVKVTSTYLTNPTQGPNVTHRLEVKKRKLIIDGKVSIPLEKQRKKPLLARQLLANAKKSNSLHINSFFPKSRQCLDSISMSAFDLLTNSNCSRCISPKLNQQFRKGCVNKASSTNSKYKLLSRVPPLQQDEQILEISRNSM